MITDAQINQKVNEVLHKISLHNINRKIEIFQHIDIPLIALRFKQTVEPVSRKRLRFYIDLAKVWYPLFFNNHMDNKTKAEFISETFKCICNEEDLEKLKSFKDITKKEILVMENDKIKTISRLRWRGRDNLRKNIIHHKH